MFPTRPGGPSNGRPLEAVACSCEGQVHRGRCLRCGNYKATTIRETFASQARHEARGQRNVYELDEYRTRRFQRAA